MLNFSSATSQKINRGLLDIFLKIALKKALVLFEKYSNKIIKPSINELKKNNPSRSAKLRFAIRSADDFTYPLDLTKKFSNYLNLEARNV